MFKKIVLFALLFVPVSLFAQDKMAYFNSAEVIPIMPEYAQMQDSIQKMQVGFQKEMKDLEDEYSKKYEAFMAEGEKLIESIRVRRMQEIQDIAQRAESYSEQFQKELQQTYDVLLQPIQQKVKDALDKVGAENNFTFIFDGSALVYVGTNAIDATSLVKKKLGLQ